MDLFSNSNIFDAVCYDVSLDRLPSQAIKNSPLNYGIRLQELSVAQALDTGMYKGLMTHRAIVRDDNDEVLGVVGNRYVIVDNMTAFKQLDWISTMGYSPYRAGFFDPQGARVWMMLRDPHQMEPASRLFGTMFMSFLIITTHNGSSGVLKIVPMIITHSSFLPAFDSGGCCIEAITRAKHTKQSELISNAQTREFIQSSRAEASRFFEKAGSDPETKQRISTWIAACSNIDYGSTYKNKYKWLRSILIGGKMKNKIEAMV